MKNLFIKLIFLTIITVSTSINAFAQEYDSLDDKFTYVFGRDIASKVLADIERLGLKKEIMLRGFNEYIEDKNSIYDEETTEKITQDFTQKMRKQMEAEQKILAEKALAEGKKYMEENKLKEGFSVTDTGIQYKVINEGNGPKPKATDKVKVHYSGKLINGKEFDSSYTRGAPIVFPLNQVIAGWTESLQLMNVGSKYEVVIPSELGYGETGVGNSIPPNSVLIFIIELLEIVEEEKKN